MKYIGVALLGTCLILGACSDTKKMAPKEGRISVISEKEIISSGEKIRLDKAETPKEWTNSNANIHNKIPAVSLKKSNPEWTIKGAEGKNKNGLPMVTPAVIGDKIYTLDSENTLTARNTKDATKLWEIKAPIKEQGVGLVANKNYVITTSENGRIAVFNTKGKQLWTKELKTPFRNTPLLGASAVYLLSINNDLWVLDVKTGKEKWHYKTIAPTTLLQGMGRPALADNTLVIPFSSGEIIGFDAVSGVLLWSQDLVGKKTFDAVASLTQMKASPVIENGIVYLLGHGDKTMAVNLKTGESLWQISSGGKTTPVISGNALFFVDNKNNLLALNKKNGNLFWKTPLEEAVWNGPYLIDEKLVLFSNQKTALVNPKDGKVSYKKTKIEGSTPAFTKDGIFFLGDDGKLYHWEKI